MKEQKRHVGGVYQFHLIFKKNLLLNFLLFSLTITINHVTLVTGR